MRVRTVIGRRIACAVLLAVVVGLPSAASADAPGTYAVGVTRRTYVDDSRSTAANGACPEIDARTLVTTVYYPAEGAPSSAAQEEAAPAAARGPYPLIVFAHGFGALPADYAALLTHWASAGYVVAAPAFPLTSRASPCGAIAGDVVEQPTDMRFLITSLLAASKRDAALEGLVDKKAIGAAGHSNGAITTYGLVANDKLRDPRVKAAAVLAGTLQEYPTGRYDFAAAPPILIVHGTDDSLVPFSRAEDAFNAARGPKGILVLTGGDHGAPVSPSAYAATTDLFEAYLRGDDDAATRLRSDDEAGVSEMTFVPKRGARTTIATLPRVVRDLKAKVTPAKQLTNGQEVTVTWSGYTPGKAVSILQCNPSSRSLANGAGCDYANARLLQPNPTGEGSVTMTVVTGPVGDGVCDADHPGCVIIVNNESSSDPANSVILDISFAEEAGPGSSR